MAEKILPLFATPVLHMTEVGMDLKKLKKFILNTKKMNDGRTLTNVGGWQSNDLQHKPNEELQKFIEILKGVATRYSIGIEIEPKYKLEQIWANVNGPKDFNERHKHLNAIYSGVYFVDVPENSGNFSSKEVSSLRQFNALQKEVIKVNEFTFDLSTVVS